MYFGIVDPTLLDDSTFIQLQKFVGNSESVFFLRFASCKLAGLYSNLFLIFPAAFHHSTTN
jgi:hypothetical protein